MPRAEIYSLLVLAYVVGLGFLSNYFLHRIDTKPILKWEEEKYPESFIAERAYQQLKILNNFGPKVVGSKANEVLAANFIQKQLQEIKANAFKPSDVSIDRQIVSGRVFGSYVNLQNIVGRLQGETNNSLLLNCHFDSAVGSPGASDDGVNCCVMMEIFRVLSKSSKRQNHTIIFLFNGSEEANLQGSHAFIKHHKWRDSIRAFINLESSGSGGREILFRTGPKHDWLVKMYRESVPRPFAQVISEELFESGVIPSATDFQIFRDYGNIPGLDFAYIEDGWRYHTRYDSIDYITMESVQHTGNNILELTKKIANSEELANPPKGTYAIYYDFLGLFLISYTASTEKFINYIVAILAFLIPFIVQTKFKLKKFCFVLANTIISMVTMALSIVLSLIACYGMATFMNVLDNTMSWYNWTFLSIGIYCSLALIVQIAVYHIMQFLLQLCCGKVKYCQASKRHRVKIYLNGVTLLWAIVTIFFTALEFRTTYLSMVLLLVSLITYILTYLMDGILSKLSKYSRNSWIFVHILGHSVSFLLCCYLWVQIQQLFIPIVGKVYEENPDGIISLICCFGMILCLSYFIPLTLLIPKRIGLYTILLTIFMACTIISFTSIGFPYSGAKHAPRVQRFDTYHIRRTHFHQNGTVKSTINNVMIVAVDRNGIRTLNDAFAGREMVSLECDGGCKDYYHCGMSFYSPSMANNIIKFTDFNATANIKPTKFNLIRSSRDEDFIDVEFSLELRTKVELELVLKNNVSLVSSNIEFHSIFSSNKNRIKFLYSSINFGINLNVPFLVTMKLSGSPESNDFATLNVMSEDSTFDQGEITPEFKEILDTFPDYTFTTAYQMDSSFYDIGLI